jgi:acyl-CoA synthetase (AMP-forming)/AMP-acid ligase II
MSLATAKAAAAGRIPVVSICGDGNGNESLEPLLHELKDPSQIDTEAFLSPKTKGFDEHAVVTIPFSSGTTGRSKGVILSHRNLTSNVLQTMPYEGKYLLKEHSKSGERGVLLCPLPFYHIFAMTAGMMVSAYCGAKLVFLPQFDLQRYLELIQEHKVSRGHVVPPIVLALAKHPMVDKYDLTSLECLMSGAAPLGAEVQLAAAKRLNCIVKQAWGMTETSPCGTITPDDDVIRLGLEAVVGRSGKLSPATEAKIVHPLTGEDQPFTSEGELLVRGPQIMKGYFENEEATKSTLRSDGWLHTGDIAKFDEQGWLYITDRSKELIKFKGFQVPPAELEAIILTMPQVKDVVVIPVLDDEAGEVPRAYVVKQDSAPADFVADDVIEFVHARVAPYKRLRGGVRFTASVPKSPSGKLLRRVQIQLDRAAPAS